jgi:uncharacterized membrane protein
VRGAGRERGAGAKLPFRVEVLIARLLLWGGLVSVALVLIGLVVYAAHGGFAHHVIDLRQRAPTGRAGHPPDVFVSLAEVLHGLTARPRDPLALVALGLVLLLMTPVLGAALAIPGFIVSRDYRYAIIASIVFAMLVVSVVLAGGAG